MPDPIVQKIHKLCLDRPDDFSRSVRAVTHALPGLHGLLGGKPTPFSLTPYIFSTGEYRRMTKLISDLTAVFEFAGENILSDGELLAQYGFPEEFLDILRIDPGYPRLAPIFRIDGHIERGVFRVVETNADGSAGMNDSNAIEQAVLATNIYRRIERESELKSMDMITPLSRMLCRHAGRIGILDLPGVSTSSEFIVIRNSLRRIGRAAEIITLAELSYRERLYARGKPVDVIYRRLVTRDALAHWQTLGPLLTAYARGQVRMVGSFRSELLHSKAILNLLHDPALQSKFPPADRRLILKHIPRSQKLDPAACEIALRQKNRWIIKPLDDYGSRGVSVGRDITAGKWRNALSSALKHGKYILQEYVEASRNPVIRPDATGRPRISNEMLSIGFFIYAGIPAGPYIRSGPTHPLSISKDAVTRPGFVTTGKRGRF